MESETKKHTLVHVRKTNTEKQVKTTLSDFQCSKHEKKNRLVSKIFSLHKWKCSFHEYNLIINGYIQKFTVKLNIKKPLWPFL